MIKFQAAWLQNFTNGIQNPIYDPFEIFDPERIEANALIGKFEL